MASRASIDSIVKLDVERTERYCPRGREVCMEACELVLQKERLKSS
jgi:hypothetical protein